jgi:hypothetical protein
VRVVRHVKSWDIGGSGKETDCVMSLAIGFDSLGLAFSMGVLLEPFKA